MLSVRLAYEQRARRTLAETGVWVAIIFYCELAELPELFRIYQAGASGFQNTAPS